ncbi:dTDP-4-dehydrorhamnose reductase family protein [Thalassospira indica]|uniref:dTDP-4-dehydrorhamnose reductase n=1 Tax=Thalassospira indica TaxID=1891279 RepID=A0ABN5NB03_9PROT|nr:SDR family oxidoreductase [Thalassospira indica]AXO13636.1 SDR family oxidoreductase [Thalassospira indica]OAZ14481.1 dTDP-4-dehydrorhamnose reductase [Thalassospira profundimaris]
MKTKILIFGASGMLGNTLLRYFSQKGLYHVVGSVRGTGSLRDIADNGSYRQVSGIDAENTDHLLRVFEIARPDVVVNCVGVVKQLAEADDELVSIPLNSLLPHRLARLCAATGSRLIHISTDCVFSGKSGGYTESDLPDAVDLYGRSKLMGEVNYPHAITLRTSLIGHELNGARSLINWFLSQEGSVRGFTKAIFSGLPTVEIARVIETHVLPNPVLHGLYHLSVDPISKHDLLTLVKDIYGKRIEIVPDDAFLIDRSLDSARFRRATGYSPKSWPELIQDMHDFG